jgi:hypothetical protein
MKTYQWLLVSISTWFRNIWSPPRLAQSINDQSSELIESKSRDFENYETGS